MKQIGGIRMERGQLKIELPAKQAYLQTLDCRAEIIKALLPEFVAQANLAIESNKKWLTLLHYTCSANYSFVWVKIMDMLRDNGYMCSTLRDTEYNDTKEFKVFWLDDQIGS